MILVPCHNRSWTTHPEVSVLYQLLKFVKIAKPLCVILENVAGLRTRDRNSDMSPLEMIEGEMTEMKYSCQAVEIDVATWHAVTRKRTS